ncbi:MAG: hypothetical protein A2252_03185 [Elusimicrobia bacterium RIFOXYA2_FULL_39_19]|nr:MAG: hypothetical protein A2252_03185 [Elusimicrobia bacterium RIFOXYA2_FULL_39_19]
MTEIKNYYEKSADIYSPQGRQVYLTHDKFESFVKLMNAGREGGQKILDIGCNNGWVSTLYRLPGDEIKGIDISEANIKKAKEAEVDAIQCDIEKELPYPDASFDIIICADVLEHLFFPENVIKEMYRVLKIGGFVIIGIPNLFCLKSRIEMLFGLQCSFIEYPYNFEHIRQFSKRSMNRLLKNYGFDVTRVIATGWYMNSEKLFRVLGILFHGGNPGLKFLLKILTFSTYKKDYPALIVRSKVTQMLGLLFPGLACGLTFKALKKGAK